MGGEYIERPLTRRRITSMGYDYVHQALNNDTAIFRQVYRMYPDVFRKLCTILSEKTPLEDTRFICVEEMLSTSENFHKVLKAVNLIAPELMAKSGSTVPAKIRESTRFYPYFKVCGNFLIIITKL